MTMLVLKASQQQMHLEKVKIIKHIIFSHLVVQFTENCTHISIGFHFCVFTRWVCALQLDISGWTSPSPISPATHVEHLNRFRFHFDQLKQIAGKFNHDKQEQGPFLVLFFFQ